MIKPEEISVVIQGPVKKEDTEKVLKSIRNFLPEAEIILSTWENQDVKGLDYDLLIENKDPGSEKIIGKTFNVNRQIVSSAEGIKKASRKYVLKLRNDNILTGTDFLNYIEKFDKRSDELKILKNRVLTCNVFACRANVFPFHPSDWIFFGLKEDVLNIFDIPLADERNLTTYFERNPLTPYHTEGPHDKNFINNLPFETTFNFNKYGDPSRYQYSPEQYIWSTFLRKYIDLNFEHIFDITEENTRLSELSFANNLIIMDCKTFNATSLKYQTNLKYDVVVRSYDFYDWQILYKKYCDNNYKMKFNSCKYLNIITTILFEVKLLLKQPKKYFKNLIGSLKYLYIERKKYYN